MANTTIDTNWEGKLKAGELAEADFYAIVLEQHPKAQRTVGNVKAYDIFCDEGMLCKTPHGQFYSWEVKADGKSYHTGNFYFEFESMGAPSGIAASTALFWVHRDYESFYVIQLDVLKGIIRDWKHAYITAKEKYDNGIYANEPHARYWVSTAGGDNLAQKGIVFKAWRLKQHPYTVEIPRTDERAMQYKDGTFDAQQGSQTVATGGKVVL